MIALVTNGYVTILYVNGEQVSEVDLFTAELVLHAMNAAFETLEVVDFPDSL